VSGPISKSGKTCSFRRTCKVCGNEYGRKLMTSGKGEGYFTSIILFRRTKTCGTDCRAIQAQKTQAENRRANKKASFCFDAFLFQGGVEL
jgi:hypothetical protein